MIRCDGAKAYLLHEITLGHGPAVVHNGGHHASCLELLVLIEALRSLLCVDATEKFVLQKV